MSSCLAVIKENTLILVVNHRAAMYLPLCVPTLNPFSTVRQHHAPKHLSRVIIELMSIMFRTTLK